MLSIIKELCLQIVDRIDAGNSNITEEQGIEGIKYLRAMLDTEKLYNRTQAAKYLHCSVQSFDLYRKEGKLPQGTKEAGGVMQWTRKQLDDFIRKYKH